MLRVDIVLFLAASIALCGLCGAWRWLAAGVRLRREPILASGLLVFGLCALFIVYRATSFAIEDIARR